MSQLKRERPVDFTEIVFSLNHHGVNTTGIAQEVGVSPQSVAQWRDGVAKPTYENASCLIGFWMFKLRLDHRMIPREG